MKKTLLLLLMICCNIVAKAQDKQVITADFTLWPDVLKNGEELGLTFDKNVVFSITKITGNDLKKFLKASTITSDSATATLEELMPKGLIKVDTPGNKVEILMADIRKKEGFETGTINAVLVKDKVKVSVPVKPGTDTGKAVPGGRQGTETPPPDKDLLYLFIPTPKIEQEWAGKIVPKQSVKLNYHTRWAIVYDFSKEDPVSIYKRLNKVLANTCDGIVMEAQRGGKKNKLSGVLKEINELDKELTGFQLKTTDSRATLRLNTIKKDFQDVSQQISAATTEEQLNAIAQKLDLLKKELDITKALYPAVQFTATGNNVLPPQCDNIYKIKEVRKLSPTVNRSLLIVVPHYHPYRDSIVLSADYGDRFLDDAALFNRTFIASTGAGAAGEEGKKAALEQQSGSAGGIKNGMKTFDLFKELRVELERYANGKMKQESLDVEMVENGVAYIKERMTAILGITDFTATGILKAAELKLKDIDKDQQEEYFKVVHEAVDLFLKIAGYKRYDNHNLLIDNKDLISLTLNRYRDGKLVTMNKETVRKYYTAGGVKVDFSVGLFGSSLVNKDFITKTEWFNDTTYVRRDNGTIDSSRIASIDSVQRKRILNKDEGNFNIGPAILTHIYWRSGTDVNFSATAGIAINQQALPRYLFGGSVMFGRDSRWVFSSGVALGPVKDLDGGYKTGDVIELNELSTIPLKDVWKSAWFLSLTFNMGGFNVGGR